jgi:hypothetical protein
MRLLNLLASLPFFAAKAFIPPRPFYFANRVVSPIDINTIRALSVGIDGAIPFNSDDNMESNLYDSVDKASDLIF